MAQIIDGKRIAAEVREEVREEVATWMAEGHRAPYLAVVLIGDNTASASYVRGKAKACAEVGIHSDTLHYPADMTEAEVLQLIDSLNHDPKVDGILVQLPLPKHINEDKVIQALSPQKDVDGFHPESAGHLVIGSTTFAPATPAGVMELLKRSGIETRGKNAVIIGRSNIVGKPMANLLIQPGIDATVTVCHSRTQNLSEITQKADILVAAIGRAKFVSAAMVKEGAVVIDVGINREEAPEVTKGYRIVGDVDFEAVSPKASWITPVPGGVGPMTIAMLLKNTLKAAKSLAS
jgi:methylenetetrahydrofolate dehydrogenase (NADP+)/methenyltetrahydrofolate cyclohydrolase